jgi:DNA-binding NtrC family response regulator
LKILKNKYPKIKVILLTGFADLENAIDAVNLGAYGFYRKSKDIFKFTKMINQIEKESLAG